MTDCLFVSLIFYIVFPPFILQTVGLFSPQWVSDTECDSRGLVYSCCRGSDNKTCENANGVDELDARVLGLEVTSFAVMFMSLFAISCEKCCSKDEDQNGCCFFLGICCFVLIPVSGLLSVIGCMMMVANYTSSELGWSFRLCLASSCIVLLPLAIGVCCGFCHKVKERCCPSSEALWEDVEDQEHEPGYIAPRDLEDRRTFSIEVQGSMRQNPQHEGPGRESSKQVPGRMHHIPSNQDSSYQDSNTNYSAQVPGRMRQNPTHSRTNYSAQVPGRMPKDPTHSNPNRDYSAQVPGRMYQNNTQPDLNAGYSAQVPGRMHQNPTQAGYVPQLPGSVDQDSQQIVASRAQPITREPRKQRTGPNHSETSGDEPPRQQNDQRRAGRGGFYFFNETIEIVRRRVGAVFHFNEN